jgi:hypothetical protein
MPATKRTIQQLYSDFSDNTTGEISASDMRNLVASIVGVTGTGWCNHFDNQYTSLSKLPVTAGTRTKVTNNSLLSNITEYLPPDASGCWWNPSTNKFMPSNVGDFYIVRFQFRCDSTAVQGAYVLTELDISDPGVSGSNIVWQHTSALVRGQGIEHTFCLTIPAFTMQTFVTNGGEFYITPSHDTNFWDFGIIINRIHRNSIPLE